MEAKEGYVYRKIREDNTIVYGKIIFPAIGDEEGWEEVLESEIEQQHAVGLE